MTRWIAILVALAIGIFMLGVDRRTDDTGVEVAILLGSALLLTLAAPRAALAIALAVGLPIAVLNGGVPALVVAFVGAAIGWAARRAVV